MARLIRLDEYFDTYGNQRLMMELEGGHRNSVSKHKPIEFGLFLIIFLKCKVSLPIGPRRNSRCIVVPEGYDQMLKIWRLNYKTMVDNVWKLSRAVVLTFAGQVLLQRVFLCHSALSVEIYTYPTIQCYDSCRYGHTKAQCHCLTFFLILSELEAIHFTLVRSYIVLAYFNCHHTLWGCGGVDFVTRTLVDIIDKLDHFILNNSTPTRRTRPHSSFSALDLSFCSPDLALLLSWEVPQAFCPCCGGTKNVHELLRKEEELKFCTGESCPRKTLSTFQNTGQVQVASLEEEVKRMDDPSADLHFRSIIKNGWLGWHTIFTEGSKPFEAECVGVGTFHYQYNIVHKVRCPPGPLPKARIYFIPPTLLSKQKKKLHLKASYLPRSWQHGRRRSVQRDYAAPEMYRPLKEDYANTVFARNFAALTRARPPLTHLWSSASRASGGVGSFQSPS
ncbi:hypothetical protein EVAR_52956_1 [Eumeta japonica]|uniref:Endonuclease/exonuclease/phosphatase domain-containing protein n=1 Tax=Eumeta variegata TaxID=151549 RepID=A0A4C1YUY6_EUMVA|nr:hypothetical protein EVAR_52956_1 [Eumeta japonica]